jgi:pyrroloquinoline quinone biosynthesis protein B
VKAVRRRTFIHSCFGAAAGLKADLLSGDVKTRPHLMAEKSDNTKNVFAKVTGTAQDGGIPHIGCFCSNCQRAWKESRFSRLISSVALFDFAENKTFLVDATPDVRAQTMMVRNRLNPKNNKQKYWPDGVLLTHAHIGHYTGLMFYGYEAQSTDRLPVYCSKRMSNFLAQNGPWSQLVDQKNIVPKTISPEKSFSLTPQITVLAFQVPHRDEYTDTLGFKIKGPNRSLLYIPDIHNWNIWDRSIVDEVQNVDMALLDGTFFSPEELPFRDLSSIGHPFITDSIKCLRDIARNGKTQIYFTHLNHSNLALDPDCDARKIMEKDAFGLATDGMEFPL